MRLGLSLSILAQKLELVGGATESIFPQAEALLLSGDGYCEALEYVATRKKMDRYRSVIDFLFCELHPEWRISCRRFYAGNGPALREQVTPEQLKECNDRMIVALYFAHRILVQEEHREDWASFREQVFEEAEIRRKAA